MSCAVFTLLGMWILYANKNNDWALRATFTLACICLFWACFLAWRDKEKEAEKLIAKLKAIGTSAIISPQEEIRTLAESIMDFVYKRAENAPSVPSWQPFFGDTQEMLKESSRASERITASMKYESETLEMYKYKYSRRVAKAIELLPAIGMSAEFLEKSGVAPSSSGAVKTIGEHLIQVADLIQKTDKSTTKNT
jgi:hypothetical protein